MARIRSIKPAQWRDTRITRGRDAVCIYIAHELGESRPCKIGIAVDPNKRLGNLQCGNWRELTLAVEVVCANRQDAIEAEQFVLGRVRGMSKPRRLQSEWIDLSIDDAMALLLEWLNCEGEFYARQEAA